jgi:NAD(P)H-hydrate epimerase
MTRAAEYSVETMLLVFPEARRWQVLCGAGNNAGDGYAVARLARNAGIEVAAVAVVDPAELSGDAATAFSDYVAAGGKVSAWSGAIDLDATLYIDALLGSGLDRALAGDFAAAVSALNATDTPVASLDIATGLHGDSGMVMGDAVRADLTVTFVGLKQGQFLGRGSEYRGLLRFSDLGVPADCYANRPVELRRISADQPADLLPKRDRNAHKGDFGHVLVVGGGRGMPGAAVLCGEAALRTGAGRVSVATDPSHAADVVNSRPELMGRGVASAAELRSFFGDCGVIAVGPGLGQSEWANELMQAVQLQAVPAVWDADALNWLAENPGIAENRIITPHPGEAASLLGISTTAVQADRKGAVEQLQTLFGGIAVLKGAGTLVKGPAADIWVSASGNPGMAAPGMGDVLTGIIAALMAQGLPLLDAATAGVEIHAQVGDLASLHGERGMIASDLLAELRSVVNR